MICDLQQRTQVRAAPQLCWEGRDEKHRSRSCVVYPGRLGAVCHGYYLLTYLLRGVAVTWSTGTGWKGGGSFVVSLATCTQPGLLESGVDRQETKALILTNNGLKSLVEIHFVGKKGRLATVSEPCRGTLCRKER